MSDAQYTGSNPARMTTFTPPDQGSDRYQPLEPSPSAALRDDATLSLRDVLTVLFRYQWLVVTCFVVVTVVVMTALMLFPRTFRASASVLVRTELQAAPSFFADVSAYNDRRESDPVARRMETEMQILGSSALATQVAHELKLGYDQVYLSPIKYFSTPLFELADRIRDRFGIISASIRGERPPAPRPSRRGPEAVSEALRKAYVVTSLKSKGAESNSNVMEITMLGPDSMMTRATLGGLVERYLVFDRAVGDAEGRRAELIVRAELADAERELVIADRELQTFLARSSRNAVLARPSVANGGTGGSVAEAPFQVVTSPRDDGSLTKLKEELVKREVELIRLSEAYLESSERIQSLRREAANLRRRINAEVATNAVNYTTQNQLSRRLGEAERRYAELHRRLREISLYLQVNAQSTGARVVVGQANVIGATRKSTVLLIGVFGAVVGLALGLLFAGALAYVDQTLSGASDVKRYLGLSVAAVLPLAPTEALPARTLLPTGRQTQEPPNGNIATSMRILAARTVGALRVRREARPGGATVLVASARRGEGTTFVATAIASQIARLRCGSVLLVDGSLEDRDASEAPEARDPAAVGVVSGVVIGSPNGAKRGPSPEISVLRASSAFDPVELMNPVRVETLLRELTSVYDFVVIDAGSVASGTPIILARAVDAVLFIVEAHETRRQVVRRALEGLSLPPDTPVAVVLNRARREIPERIYALL